MRPILFSLALLPALCVPIAAHAESLIFDLSPTNGLTGRAAGSAPAQGVIASHTVKISGFSLFLQSSAENLNFFITDGTGTDVLYSGVEAVGATSSPGWVESNPLSFKLHTGLEYYFGVVGDGSYTGIGYIYPPVVYSSNGLTADDSGNANTYSFSNPTLDLNSGSAEIGLRLYSNADKCGIADAGNCDDVAATPEPNSLMLLGTGVLSAAGLVRRRLGARS